MYSKKRFALNQAVSNSLWNELTNLIRNNKLIFFHKTDLLAMAILVKLVLAYK